jgi:hypothetical protein
MNRWPMIILTFALAGSAVCLVVWRVVESAESRPCPCEEVAEDQNTEATILRIFAKRQLARETAAGRRSLVEAAALFRELNRLPPALQPAEGPFLTGRTEEERLCRQVIGYVANLEHDRSEAAADAAVARLEAELQEELERHGAVRLLDPADLPSAAELKEQARARMSEAERWAYLPARRGAPPGQ